MKRIALVTGAGRGIGRAIAIGLARDGHRVGVTARTREQLAEVAAQVRDVGGEPLAVEADLSERAAASAVVDRVRATWGEIEILVNNAGIGSSAAPQPLVDFDDEFWELTMRVNLTAPYLLTKQVLPAMLAAGWGRIVNIASINGKIPALHGAAYTASKHALVGLTKATAREAGERGVTCNAVCPGVTATTMNDKRLDYDVRRTGQTREQLEQAASLLGRRLLPEEVAHLAVFLASDSAGAINGQAINVCGGLCFQ